MTLPKSTAPAVAGEHKICQSTRDRRHATDDTRPDHTGTRNERTRRTRLTSQGLPQGPAQPQGPRSSTHSRSSIYSWVQHTAGVGPDQRGAHGPDQGGPRSRRTPERGGAPNRGGTQLPLRPRASAWKVENKGGAEHGGRQNDGGGPRTSASVDADEARCQRGPLSHPTSLVLSMAIVSRQWTCV